MGTASVRILGVTIDPVTPGEALARIIGMLDENTQCHVVTPNNEMLVEASRNPQFRDVLNAASLRIPDSTGLLIAARVTGQHLPSRVTGVDTVEGVCFLLNSEHSVFFLGGRDGAGAAAAAVLQRNNPHLAIADCYEGSPGESHAEAIIAKINASGAHLLFVAYGAPAQDLWIAKYLPRLTSVRVAMGVGGTFDFLSGRVRRAPSWLRSLGLEWLWRLIQEPKRFGRIWKAVVVFPWLVLKWGRCEPCD